MRLFVSIITKEWKEKHTFLTKSSDFNNKACVKKEKQLFSKRVLTSNGKACNIIQVADEHGNMLQQNTLMGKPSGGLTTKELLKNFFKKVLDKINVLRYYIEAVSSKQH